MRRTLPQGHSMLLFEPLSNLLAYLRDEIPIMSSGRLASGSKGLNDQTSSFSLPIVPLSATH